MRRARSPLVESLEVRRLLTTLQPYPTPSTVRLTAASTLFTATRSFGVASIAGQPANELAVSSATPFSVNWSKLVATLVSSPTTAAVQSGTSALQIALPSPSGVLQRFQIETSDVMSPGLAAQLPGVRTFRGVGIDDPTATIALDYTQLGFHASVLTSQGNGSWYIDPYFLDDANATHMSYYRSDLAMTDARKSWTCTVDTDAGTTLDLPVAAARGSATADTVSGTTLHTYRLAVAATGEYTDYHTPGTGTPVAANGEAAIVTAIARVNQVYESELSIHLTLVPNNLNLVYTNASTDPYTNNDGEAMLTQNQSTITSIIGSANYDIGHVFSTGGGGIADLGSVGVTSVKAEGVTGSPDPIGDAFTIDYVAHEMGHQFGANHTFNTANDTGNRNASTAYEPGSGSTIMAYAGIEGSDDLQPHSDPYFHSVSLDEIFADIAAHSSVGTTSSTANTAPTVSTVAAYTIPANTPFALTAVGSDANGDALTYDWQERDVGSATLLTAADNGKSPLFRVYAPTSSPTRTFPKLASILAGSLTTAAPSTSSGVVERLPNLARTAMKFRVIVRDNRAGGRGIATADTSIKVVATGAAFAITSFNAATTIAGGSLQTITWTVAGTTASPISAANVNILLSTDGGQTFGTVLAASTPNDGSQQVTFPAGIASSSVRIKVQPTNNIFFDINNANLNLTNVPTNSATPAAPVLLASADSGVSNSDGLTNFNNLTPAAALSFSISNTVAGALVEILEGSTVLGSATATGTTTTVTLNSGVALTDGTHTFIARQTETSKPVSANSTSTSVTIDATAPAKPFVLELDTASDSGVASDDGITNDNTPTLNLSVPAVYFRLSRNGTTVSGDYANGISFTDTPLADGVYTYELRTVDAAGNVSAQSLSTTVTIDTVAPALAAPTTFNFETEQSVEYALSEDVGATIASANVSVTTLDGTAVDSTTTYDAATRRVKIHFPTLLTDGDYTATLSGLTDAAGNTMAATTFGFFVLAGDANRDRQVSFDDLLMLASHFTQTGQTFSAGNFNYSADGSVDFDDLLVLAGQFTKTLPTPAAALASTTQTTRSRAQNRAISVV